MSITNLSGRPGPGRPRVIEVAGEPPVASRHAADDQADSDTTRIVLVSLAGALLLYVAIGVHRQAHLPVLRGFVVLVLALLPGLLYLRFLRQRLEPLRDEYLYNLHRLGIDSPEYLPEPPLASKFHQQWAAAGGSRFSNVVTIYQRKFSTQYGFSHGKDELAGAQGLGNLIAVLICTLTLSVGLAAVVWYPPTAASTPVLQAALGFGFLGAYFFVISALTRRNFQNDLRPGAYLMATVRVITVLLLVTALVGTFAGRHLSPGTVDVFAFTIGVFPAVALQLMRRTVGRMTGWARGGLEPPFPLGQLDGVDIWSEARLLEVGIEDVQHLAQANLVDVSLATRIPMQRMVDWVDQGLLILHTRLPRGGDEADDRSTYRQLRCLGVRSATDLVLLVDALGLDFGRRRSWPSATDPAVGALVSVEGAPALALGGLLTRAAVIALLVRKEPNFQLVRNWQLDGDRPSPHCTTSIAPPIAPPQGESSHE